MPRESWSIFLFLTRRNYLLEAELSCQVVSSAFELCVELAVVGLHCSAPPELVLFMFIWKASAGYMHGSRLLLIFLIAGDLAWHAVRRQEISRTPSAGGARHALCQLIRLPGAFACRQSGRRTSWRRARSPSPGQPRGRNPARARPRGGHANCGCICSRTEDVLKRVASRRADEQTGGGRPASASTRSADANGCQLTCSSLSIHVGSSRNLAKPLYT